MKAIILARVSDKKQDSNEAQVIRVSDYVRQKQLTIWKTYEIEESSTKGDRKKFQELIHDIEQSEEPIALIVDTVDRLQRSFKESVILDELRRAGKLEIHFYRENLVIHKNSNSSDILRWDMAVMFAKSYVLQLSDNVKRKLDQMVKDGKSIGKPYTGYKSVYDLNGKRINLIPDLARKNFVVKIFEMYASGNYSLRQIQEEMRKLGLTSNTKNPKPLSISQIYATLKNPFFYGMMEIKGNLYPHYYEPLISKELFDRCQSVMDGYHKKPFKYAGKEFALRGLIRCADCGCTITPETTKGHNYYSCTNYKRMHAKRLYINENDLLKPIYKEIERLRLPQDKIDEITSDFKRMHESKNEFHDQAILALNKQYNQIENKIKRLWDLRLEDEAEQSITKDFFNNKFKELNEEKTEIRVKLKTYDKADENFYITANTVLNLCRYASEIFKSSEPNEKRQLLNFLLQNCLLKGRDLDFTLRKPFDSIAKYANCSTLLPG